MPKTLHTMAQAYQEICAGEDPWTALGNFKNAWYDYARGNRAALVSEPLKKPYQDTIVNLADAVVLQHRRETTPLPFARRNVFCGNRLYQNKYELSEWLQEARSKGLRDPRDMWRYA